MTEPSMSSEELYIDRTPLTLSIEMPGGICLPVIDRGTPIPVSRSIIITTVISNQPSVEIHVLQGERPMAPDNRTLGRFMLDGILPAPRCAPRIVLTLEIDANGILILKAHDKGTGREQKISITASAGLSKDEVERMIKDRKSVV
jgi:molecular chaperone DnaK